MEGRKKEREEGGLCLQGGKWEEDTKLIGRGRENIED